MSRSTLAAHRSHSERTESAPLPLPGTGAVPVFLRALWIVGAVAYAAIVLAFTALTYHLDEIKTLLLFVLAPILWILLATAFVSRRTQPLHPWIGRTLFAYVFLGLLSTLLARYGWRAWQEFGFELCLMAAFGVTALATTTVRHLRRIALFLFAVGCATVVFGLFHYYGGVSWMLHALYPPGAPRRLPWFHGALVTLDRNHVMFSTILSRDFYPAYLVMMLPLSGALLGDSRRTLPRLLFAGAAVVFGFTMLLARSNDSNLALLVMLVLFPALLCIGGRRIALPRRTALLATAGALLLLAGGLFLMRSYVLAAPRDLLVGVKARSIIWSGAWQVFFDPDQPLARVLHHLVAGSGPGGFFIYFPQYRAPNFLDWEIAHITLFAHNQPLDLLAERGLLGAAAFAGFLGGLLWLLVRQIRRRTDATVNVYQAALVCGLVGISIQSLTSPAIRWTVCGLTYWLVLGLAAATIRLGAGEAERARLGRAGALSPASRRFAGAAFVTAALLLAVCAIPFGVNRFVGGKLYKDGYTRTYGFMTGLSQFNSLAEGTPGRPTREQLLQAVRLVAARFDRSLQWMPTHLNARYQLGYMWTRYLALGDDPQAIAEGCRRGKEAYGALERLAPGYAELDLMYGLHLQLCYTRMRNPDDKALALERLERAARRTEDLGTQWTIANTFIELNELGRVRTAYWRMLEIARCRTGKFQAHAANLDTILQMLETDALAKNDTAQLARVYRYRIAFHPADARALTGLVEALRSLEREEEALADLDPLIRRRPDDPLPRTLALPILVARQRHAEALEHIETLIRIERRRRAESTGPPPVVAGVQLLPLETLLLHSAESLQALGRADQARARYGEVLTVTPASRAAQRAKKALADMGASEQTEPIKPLGGGTRP